MLFRSGRTGTIAACLLVELGLSADDAIAAVRHARSPRAIETAEQEEYVRRCAAAKPQIDIDAMVAYNLVSGAYDRYLYWESDEPLLCPNGHVVIEPGVRRYVFGNDHQPFKAATYDDAFFTMCPTCEAIFNLPPSWDYNGPIHTQMQPPTSPQTRQIYYGRIRTQ